MKKLIKLLLLTFLLTIPVFIFSQEQLSYKTITVDAGASGTQGNLDVTSDVSLVYITTSGAVTLGDNWTISATGAPTEGMVFEIRYNADITLGGFIFTVFGTALTAEQAGDGAINKLAIFSVYMSGAWKTYIFQSVNNAGWVVPNMIKTNGITTTKILDVNVTLAKLEALASANIILGNVSNRPTAVGITGDIGMTNAGLVSITGLVIVNADINAAANIDYSKLNLTGSILSADLSGSIDWAKMLGLTINRVPVIDATGKMTASAITSTQLSYLDPTSSIQTQLNAKMGNSLTDTYLFIGNGSNIATGRIITGDIAITNTGVTSISGAVIVNADVNAAAAIDYSKLNLGLSIVNADINAAAAIAYSKLNLTGSILSADLSGSVAWNKMVALTASRAAVTDGAGVVTISATTAIEIGYSSGVTSAIQTQLNAKQGTALADGKVWVGSGAGVATEQTMTGDVHVSNTGVATIQPGSIDGAMMAAADVPPSKLTTALQKEMIVSYLSFEANYLGLCKIRIPYKCDLIYAHVAIIKDIEGTNDAYITFQDNASTNMSGGSLVAGKLTITAAGAIGTVFTTAITGNNSFTAGQVLQLTTSKVTAGGVVIISLEFERQD